jgi:maltodextrin utilization protein YvdJ
MDVLKFGGTSVANATNIKKSISIFTQAKYSNSIVVVSALSGVTDLLIQTAIDASISNGNYLETLFHIEQKHISCVNELIEKDNADCIEMVEQHFSELEDICEGVYRLSELTARTKDRIVSYGELLSSKIISAYLTSINQAHQWIDSREVIITDSNFGNANVDFEKTNNKINSKFKIQNLKLLVAGEFYEDKKIYDDLIENLGIKDMLILKTDFIPDSEVKYYLCAADFVIQPYKNATQSGVTPLAYHFEKPMLVTNVGGLPDLVPNEKVGLIAEPNAQSIAQKIEELYSFGEQHFLPYLQQEKKKYSWSVLTKTIVDLASIKN